MALFQKGGLRRVGSARLAEETEASRLISLVCGREPLGRNARGVMIVRMTPLVSVVATGCKL